MTSESAFLPLGYAGQLCGKGSPSMAAQDLQQHTSCISAEDFRQIVRGDLIAYLLAPDMQPTDPLREWHGRVEAHGQAGWVKVTLLDEEYVGLTETVWRTEILSVAKRIE